MQKTNKASQDFKGRVNDTIDSVESFANSFSTGDISSVYGSGQTAWKNIESFAYVNCFLQKKWGNL